MYDGYDTSFHPTAVNSETYRVHVGSPTARTHHTHPGSAILSVASRSFTPTLTPPHPLTTLLHLPLPCLISARVGAAAMIVRHVSGGGDAEYAVKRLVRGMCSSRESARQGFASCLTQVLSVLPEKEVSFAR